MIHLCPTTTAPKDGLSTTLHANAFAILSTTVAHATKSGTRAFVLVCAAKKNLAEIHFNGAKKFVIVCVNHQEDLAPVE